MGLASPGCCLLSILVLSRGLGLAAWAALEAACSGGVGWGQCLSPTHPFLSTSLLSLLTPTLTPIWQMMASSSNLEESDRDGRASGLSGPACSSVKWVQSTHSQGCQEGGTEEGYLCTVKTLTGITSRRQQQPQPAACPCEHLLWE